MKKNTILLVTFGVLLSIISACSTLQFGSADSRWADYKNWTKITEGKVVTGDHSGFLGDVHRGPEGYRDVFVNDIGLETIKGKAPYRYPIGTVIVKEQYKNKKDWMAQKNAEHTIMIKVADNQEETEGNWLWGAGLTGKAKANTFCSGCHIVVEEDDYVITNGDFLRSMK